MWTAYSKYSKYSAIEYGLHLLRADERQAEWYDEANEDPGKDAAG
jgi:hypothetical protein